MRLTACPMPAHWVLIPNSPPLEPRIGHHGRGWQSRPPEPDISAMAGSPVHLRMINSIPGLQSLAVSHIILHVVIIKNTDVVAVP